MAGIKTARANAILDDELGVSPASTRWLALYTVAPTATTDGTEVAGGAYVRQTAAFDAAAAGASQNSALVTFPAATASWGNVVGWAVIDAASGGSQRVFKGIAPVSVGIGDVVKFNAGEIDVTVS